MSLDAPALRTTLDGIAQTQGRLLAVLEGKRAALTKQDLPALETLGREEAAVLRQLQNNFRQRQELINAARQQGLPVETLRELAGRLLPAGDPGHQACQEVQRLSLEIQQASWVFWVLTQRATRFCEEVVSLVARQGRPANTYSERPDESVIGGSMLDVSL